jgi:hypothetical protein
MAQRFDRMTIEARTTFRRPVDLDATITLSGREPSTCRIQNLSLGGAFVAKCQATIGDRIHITFRLPMGETLIDSDATVAWHNRDGIGVQFAGLRAGETWALTRFFALPVGVAQPVVTR